MRVQLCSDLHLELKQNRDWLQQNPLVPSGDILIIAGDTYYLGEDFGSLDFIKKVSDDFKMTYIIPGNHEYYGGYDIATAYEATRIEIKKNVVLLNNTTEHIEGVDFIFSTLWSHIQRNILEIYRGMTDFRRIIHNGERFTINHFNDIHHACFDFITKEVNKEGKKIVVTHHLPSEACNAEEYKGSILNDAFCVDKTRFIEKSNIDYWIYGHSHRNLPDINIEGTKMVTNQLGYIGYLEHTTFNPSKIIEI